MFYNSIKSNKPLFLLRIFTSIFCVCAFLLRSVARTRVWQHCLHARGHLALEVLHDQRRQIDSLRLVRLLRRKCAAAGAGCRPCAFVWRGMLLGGSSWCFSATFWLLNVDMYFDIFIFKMQNWSWSWSQLVERKILVSLSHIEVICSQTVSHLTKSSSVHRTHSQAKSRGMFFEKS